MAAPHAAVQDNIDELMKTLAADIAALRTALGPTRPEYMDDVSLLRFCLSFEGLAKREAAARRCIAWRAANATLLADAAAGRPPPKNDVITRHVIAGSHASRSIAGEPLYVVRAGLCNPGALLQAVSAAEFLAFLMWHKEVAFIACDAATRQRRVLVKMISLVDLAGITLAHGTEAGFQKTVGESGKISEDVYPQLLARSVIMHPPGFFWVIFSLFKHFMSAKVLAKMGVCPGRSADKPTASSCPFASARFRLADLPSFLGGTCRCTAHGGCVSGTPNEQKAPRGEGGGSVTVAAGGAHEVCLTARAPGDRLAWEFKLEDKGLEVSAWVTPEAGPPVTLLPAKKYKAEDGAVTGSAVVPVAGAVTFKLDNSHSRFTQKTARVSVLMLPAVAEVAAAAAEAPPADGTQ